MGDSLSYVDNLLLCTYLGTLKSWIDSLFPKRAEEGGSGIGKCEISGW